MGGNNQRKYQTGQALPIVGVVNKENGFGDYYFQQFPDGEAFTITKPTTITSITTSIHDPDMSFARVDEGSAIIYRIKKNKWQDPDWTPVDDPDASSEEDSEDDLEEEEHIIDRTDPNFISIK